MIKLKIPTFLHSRGKLLILGALVVALGVGIAPSAYASIPDANGKVHTCYAPSGLLLVGYLRVINTPAQSCNAGETALDWEAGPQAVQDRLTVAYGQASNNVILAVPGFGELQAAECEAGEEGDGESEPLSPSSIVYFKNTSGHSVDVTGGGTRTVLANNQTLAGLSPTFHVGYTNGTDHVASVSLSGGAGGTYGDQDACYYQAQAIMSED